VLLGDERRHDVSIVALRDRSESIRPVRPGSLQHIDVYARTQHEAAGEIPTEAAERSRIFVDDRYGVAGARETLGQRRANAAATDYEVTHELQAPTIAILLRANHESDVRDFARESPACRAQRKEALELRSNENRSAPVGA
jgi:hypothetical protein